MLSFNEIIAKWQPFFAAVAGVAATLAGLLFVALSINRDKITGQKTRALLRVARRSFGDLIFALFISLLFLMPAYQPTTLGFTLLIPTAFRTVWLAYSLTRAKGDPKSSGNFREHTLSALSALGMIGVSIQICRGSAGIAFLVVPVISLLLYNASVNAWALLLMEKSSDESP